MRDFIVLLLFFWVLWRLASPVNTKEVAHVSLTVGDTIRSEYYLEIQQDGVINVNHRKYKKEK
jgi:hypothetical protein